MVNSITASAARMANTPQMLQRHCIRRILAVKGEFLQRRISLPVCRVPFAIARWRQNHHSIFSGVAKAVARVLSVIYLILNSNLNLTFSVCMMYD